MVDLHSELIWRKSFHIKTQICHLSNHLETVHIHIFTDAEIDNRFLKLLFCNRSWFLDTTQPEYIITWQNCLKSPEMLRGAPPPKKRTFFWEISPKCGWGGWFPNKVQTAKKNKITPKIAEFHLLFSQISQKPWGGWVDKHIWERSPKKKHFFLLLP